MLKSEFQYGLPESLIAQTPLEDRSTSRLLQLDGATGVVIDRHFAELPELLNPGDLLVFNDTRVIPARLFGRKDSGGRVEILIERIVDRHRALAQIRASKRPKPGRVIELDDSTRVTVGERQGEFYQIDFPGQGVFAALQEHGHIPLPPYIQRPDRTEDHERYQTVYAKYPGAVAAPTAGLHFDRNLLDRLRQQGVGQAFVTLHVGAGTFQPVRKENIKEHRMHQEWCTVSDEVCQQIIETCKHGGRIVAVGTTTVRTLETAARSGTLQAFTGETDIFIYPGYRFKTIDVMITNFHLPESTLLMLVCAFAGREYVLNAYRHAVGQQYRFYSYGDAMFVTPSLESRA